ncbi:MAG: hypothetical protein IJZ06_04195 [Bacteroidales bacterium]|nr:hypothetical protein [Bacteroidales bacterium]
MAAAKKDKTDSSAEIKALQAEVNALKAELEKTKKALADALKQKDASKPAPPKQKTMKDGHEYVDLGLPSGLKWAACNIGADKLEQYGDYFAWAETKTKKEYIKENSKSYAKDRNDISGSSRYDAARANWGGSWRMPTKGEMEELIKLCKWTWTTINGINGYNVKGLNGNSIFLPAAGCRDGSSLYYAGIYGIYWSSTPRSIYFAYGLFFNSSSLSVSNYNRNYGYTVRPVSE